MKKTDAERRSAVPPQWVHSKVTLDEIEVKNRAKGLISPEDCPEWRKFKSLIQEGDELWCFTSPPKFFFHCAGSMGYVIIRNGEQVDNFVAIMN